LWVEGHAYIKEASKAIQAATSRGPLAKILLMFDMLLLLAMVSSQEMIYPG
jgi:hypothetical protein